ncbi:protein translocase subunit SecD [Stappia indica]|uniref:Multifunctional fusion protein n=1 Tax=Stappia indica TaxID=538381 RepID=A0A857C5L6_9HYPH|nr:protein translocase subunit SecD [Stappia indica]QGZ34270.1 protein translocase subunit SecD [Stappia indica]
MKTSRWVLVTYTLIILFGLLAALPNVFTPAQLERLPGWFPKQQVTLGLDLRGGSHLVLEVDADALKADRLKSLVAEARALLRKEQVEGTVRRVGDGVAVSVPDEAARAGIVKQLRDLATPVANGGFGPAVSDIEMSTEGERIRLGFSEAGFRDRLNQAIDQSLEIVRQRVDQVGVAEPTIQRVGADRILVQLPGLNDPTRLRELLGSTAQMSFHMVADTVPGARLPAGVSLLPEEKTGRRVAVEDRVALGGDHLTDARAGFDQRTNEPIVSFRFDSSGARQFARITSQNVGKPFAIVLDGKVLSAPVIREPITGGTGQISGSFTVEDTVVLSALLRAGALPVPLVVIEERTVGPDLGGDVIEMGIVTGLAGFAAVVVFMVALYGGWGLFANFALFLNVALTVGLLSLLGATLTLPGIAGIILGIGLAVDANILINERIREEARAGASAFAALDRGFSRAYSTIVDANVTSLIATGLLFLFGSGPVRGFAITMMIGICVSMFTAVAVVRILMTEWVRRRKLKTISVEPLIRIVPDGTSISFMKARFFGIGLSIVLSLASIGLFIKPGLNYGIDFKGGIQVEASTPDGVSLASLRDELGRLDLGEVSLQQIGENVLIRIQRQEGGETAQTRAVSEVRNTLQRIDPGIGIERTEVVGPKVSGELARNGVIAVVLASLAMLAYIWWRFEWNFAIGAIATLVLDTTKTVGFFALFGLDFNLTAIAALLTIIGYSVNDKVVVYDRMRENIRMSKKRDLRSIIDLSINQVLARCLFTSATTFLAMLPMAIWGGNAVENFALPMLFGVVIATSSSIFIAAPILLLLGDWWTRRKEAAAAAAPEAERTA